jgi:hypothetical protein
LKAIVNLIDGLPLKDPKAQIELSFEDVSFVIVEKGFSRFKSIAASTFKIPLKNILDTILTTEDELLEKSKSVIGRGVAGGLLFGPAGLLLGGLSGIGKKRTSKKTYLYIVSYVSADDEQIKNITFAMPLLMLGVTRKFDNLLKKKLDSTTPSEFVRNYRDQNTQTVFNL